LAEVREAEAKAKADAEAEDQAKRMAASEGMAGVEDAPEQGSAGASIPAGSMAADPQVASAGTVSTPKGFVPLANKKQAMNRSASARPWLSTRRTKARTMTIRG
jgi:hypothetical protein